MIGTTVSHYRILDKLGGGGMGMVFKAQDTRLGRLVALKFLPPELTRDPTAKQRFIQEARTAALIDHPHVCAIHEIDETAEGQVFICMALCDGESLRARVARGPIGIEDTLVIATQIAEGLAQAHEHGIVHRDIKPANLMVGGDGRVQIVDFGLATLAGEARLTRSGVVVGTAAYMSPEQIAGGAIDARTDLWALGVVMYEMLTGRLPFASEHGLVQVDSIRFGSFPPIESVRTGVPSQLIAIVEKCLRKEPARRYQTALELRDELRSVRRGLSSATASTLPGTPPVTIGSRRFGGRKAAWALLGAAAVVALGYLAVSSKRAGFLERLGGSAADEPRHMAVLEFANVGGDPANRAFCDGLTEVLASALTEMEQRSGSIWVVPMSEVRARQVRSAGDARRVFGANLAITGGVQREGDHVRLALNVVDTKTLRQLRSAVIDEPLADLTAVEDRVENALAGMLNLPGTFPSGTRPLPGGARVPAAFELYLRARGTLESVTGPPDAPAAVELFKRAIALDPTFVLAHAGLGDAYLACYRASKDPRFVDEAIVSCRRAAALDNRLAAVHVTLGLVHTATGRHQEAIAEFRGALALEPRNTIALGGLARALEQAGQPADAEAAYKQITAIKPDYWLGHNDLGSFYFRQNRFHDAEKQYRVVVSLTPENSWGYNNLGGALMYQDRWDEARAMFVRSVGLQPNYGAYSNLGSIDFRSGRYADAAQWYEKALRLDDQDYSVWGNLAAATYWAPGRRDGARDLFERAARMAGQRLSVNPDDPEVLTDLALYRAMVDDRHGAQAYLRKVLKANPADPSLAFTLTLVFEQLGERDRALEWARRALAAGAPAADFEVAPSLAGLRADSRFHIPGPLQSPGAGSRS